MSNIYAIFLAIFVAELGDKTQIAALLFASDQKQQPLVVFLTACAALIVSTAIAVILGAGARQWLTMIPLKAIAGIGFIGIGIWNLYEHFQN